MTSAQQWATWAAAILLQCILAGVVSRRPFVAFRRYVWTTLAGEFVFLAIGLAQPHGGPLYMNVWRPYALGKIILLAAVVIEIRRPVWLEVVIAVFATGAFAVLQHHARVWPAYWLEPVYLTISWSYCFLGLLALRGGSWHSRVLAAWLLLTAALYSGAALSPLQVGGAIELLNCAAMLGWILLG